MSFVGPSEERKITTTTGKTYKIFLTQQVGGYYVATVLFANNGAISTSIRLAKIGKTRIVKACQRVLDNIDKKAVIEPL